MPYKLYLKVGDIKGDCKDKGHEGDVVASNWNWGVSRPPTYNAADNVRDGPPNFQELTVSKWVDVASPRLMLAACSGEKIPKVILELCPVADAAASKGVKKASAPQPVSEDIVRITMEKAMIIVSTAGGSTMDSQFYETLSFSCARVTYECIPKDGKPTQLRWDITKNTTF